MVNDEQENDQIMSKSKKKRERAKRQQMKKEENKEPENFLNNLIKGVYDCRMNKKVEYIPCINFVHVINSRYLSFGRYSYLDPFSNQKTPYTRNLGVIIDQQTSLVKVNVVNPSYKFIAYLQTKLSCVFTRKES